MEKKKKNILFSGKSYLNDFHMSASGEFIYGGKTYRYMGDDFQDVKKKLILYTGIVVIVSLMSGIIPIPGVMNTWYVILPYVMELLLSIFLGYKVVVLFKRTEVREYELKKTYKEFPSLIYGGMIGSFLAIIGEIIFLILNDTDEIYLVILFLISRAICLSILYVCSKVVKNIKYVDINETIPSLNI